MRDETGVDGVALILFFCRNFLQIYRSVQGEKTESLQNFAFRLRQLSERRNLKQVQIARALNLTSSRVGNWFQGLNFPRDEELQSLATLLQVQPDFLLSVTDKQEASDTRRSAENNLRPAPIISPATTRGNSGVNINPDYAMPDVDPEPTVQEVTDLALVVIGEAKKIPGGLYQLRRALRRFRKDIIDPVED